MAISLKKPDLQMQTVTTPDELPQPAREYTPVHLISEDETIAETSSKVSVRRVVRMKMAVLDRPKRIRSLLASTAITEDKQSLLVSEDTTEDTSCADSSRGESRLANFFSNVGTVLLHAVIPACIVLALVWLSFVVEEWIPELEGGLHKAVMLIGISVFAMYRWYWSVLHVWP